MQVIAVTWIKFTTSLICLLYKHFINSWFSSRLCMDYLEAFSCKKNPPITCVWKKLHTSIPFITWCDILHNIYMSICGMCDVNSWILKFEFESSIILAYKLWRGNTSKGSFFLVVEAFFYVKIASKRFIPDQVELSIVICCFSECNSELLSLRP